MPSDGQSLDADRAISAAPPFAVGAEDKCLAGRGIDAEAVFDVRRMSLMIALVPSAALQDLGLKPGHARALRIALHACRALVQFGKRLGLAERGELNRLQRAIGRARKHIANRNARSNFTASPIARAASRPAASSWRSVYILWIGGAPVGRLRRRIGMPYHQHIAALAQRVRQRRTGQSLRIGGRCGETCDHRNQP